MLGMNISVLKTLHIIIWVCTMYITCISVYIMNIMYVTIYLWEVQH